MPAHPATALFLAASSLLALSACSAEEQASPIVLREEMMLRPGEAPPPLPLLIPDAPDVVDLQATSDEVIPLPVLDPYEGDIQAETKTGETSASDAEANSDINQHADKQGANQFFNGEWAYMKKCDFGHFVNIMYKQAGNDVSGEWSIGTYLRGSDGFLKGTIRGGKLFVRYCSQDGENGYEACPKYGDEMDYFIRQDNELIRYQKLGDEYRKDITLHRKVAGKKPPIDSATCQQEVNEESAP